MFSGRIFMLAVLCSTAGSGYAGERWSQGFDPDSWTVTEQGARGILGNPNSALLHRQAFMPVEDSLNMRQVGFYGIGPMSLALALKDNFLFFGAEFGFMVFDISADPANPSVVAEITETPHFVFEPILNGDYLYILEDGLGIVTYDISDPTKPQRLSRTLFPIPGSYLKTGLVSNGNLYAIAYYESDFECCSLVVFSLVNPSKPEYVLTSGLPEKIRESTYSWIDQFDSTRLIITGSKGGVCIIDVTEPNNPQLSDSFEFADSYKIHSPCICTDNGSVIYAELKNPDYKRSFVFSFDATDLSSLVALDSLEIPYVFTWSCLMNTGNDTLLWGRTIGGEFDFIDVSDPTELKQISYFEDDTDTFPFFAFRDWLRKGNMLYAADAFGGLRILDVGDVNNAGVAGWCCPGFDVYQAMAPLYGGELIVSGTNTFWPEGVIRFNTSKEGAISLKPTSPCLLGRRLESHDIARDRDLLVISADYTLTFYRIWDDSTQKLSAITRGTKSEDWVRRMWIDGTRLFAGCGNQSTENVFPGKVIAMDISNPENPEFISETMLPGKCSAISEQGGLVYVAGRDSLSESGYLSVYRFNGEFELVSKTYLETQGQGICIQGSKLYLSRLDAMDIYDISNPQSPKLLSVTNEMLVYRNNDIVASGNRVYVASEYELLAFDVSDATSPQLTGYYIVPPAAYWGDIYTQRLRSDGNFLYWSTVCMGICVIDPYGDAEMVAEPSMDNPSPLPLALEAGRGSGRKYAIRYSLPAQADVNISVYDASGRRLKVLRASRETAGTHLFTWDAGGVSSGVYFVRLATSAGSATAKLLVLD